VLRQHYPESRFSRDAVEALLSYGWPGNVRELKNIVFGAVLQAKDAHLEISASDLRFPDSVSSSRRTTAAAELDQVEKRAILQALENSGGNQGKAAEALGISRRTLIRKLKIYREAGLEDSSGSLSLSQQRYYRAQLELPIKMKYAGELFDAVLLNISAGGAGTKTDKLLKSGSTVALVFSIPGGTSETPVELSGRVWRSSRLPPDEPATLAARRDEEGWLGLRERRVAASSDSDRADFARAGVQSRAFSRTFIASYSHRDYGVWMAAAVALTAMARSRRSFFTCHRCGTTASA
jgi:DNA-binding transcriptional ArsR family regulator